jgi:hypothetical protein
MLDLAGKRLNKHVFYFQIFAWKFPVGHGMALNKTQAQNGRYRANFREVPTFSSGFMRPISMAAEMTWDTTALLLSGRWKRSRSDWLVILSDITQPTQFSTGLN